MRKEISRLKLQPVAHALHSRVLFEDRPHLTQIEADSGQVWMGTCHLNREIALSGRPA